MPGHLPRWGPTPGAWWRGNKKGTKTLYCRVFAPFRGNAIFKSTPLKNSLRYTLGITIVSFFLLLIPFCIAIYTADPDQVDHPQGMRYRLKSEYYTWRAKQMMQKKNPQEAIRLYEKVEKIQVTNRTPNHPLLIPIYSALQKLYREVDGKAEMIQAYEKIMRIQLAHLPGELLGIRDHYKTFVHHCLALKEYEEPVTVHKQLIQGLETFLEEGDKDKQNEGDASGEETDLGEVAPHDEVEKETAPSNENALEEPSSKEDQISTPESIPSENAVESPSSPVDEEDETPKENHRPHLTAEEQTRQKTEQIIQELHFIIAHFFYQTGAYEKSLKAYVQTLEQSPLHLDKNSETPDVSTHYIHMAMVAYHAQDYTTALATLNKVLELYAEEWGPASPQVAEIYNYKGIIALAQGDFPTAESYVQQAFEIREAALPPHDDQLAISYYTLGTLFEEKNNTEEAFAHYQKAFAIWHLNPAQYPLKLAKLLQRLSSLSRQTKDYDQALKNIDEAIAYYRTKLADGHPDLIVARTQKAHLYKIQKKYAAANELFHKVLRILLTQPPSKEIDIEVALIYKHQGDIAFLTHHYRDAIKNYERALDILVLRVTDEEYEEIELIRRHRDLAVEALEKKKG